MQNPQLWEIVLSVVVILVGIGAKALIGAKWSGAMEDQLFTAISAAAQRAKDKFVDEIARARADDSDGGTVVTVEELSRARQAAFDYVLDSLKGPALDYAKTRGADFVKGLIGGTLDKILDRSGIKVAAVAPEAKT